MNVNRRAIIQLSTLVNQYNVKPGNQARRAKVSQLRSRNSKILNSYLSRLDESIPDIVARITARHIHHLFNCPSHPNYFTSHHREFTVISNECNLTINILWNIVLFNPPKPKVSKEISKLNKQIQLILLRWYSKLRLFNYTFLETQWNKKPQFRMLIYWGERKVQMC